MFNHAGFELKEKNTMQNGSDHVPTYVFCDSLSGLKAAYEAGFSPQIKVLTRSPAILEAMPSNSMNWMNMRA